MKPRIMALLVGLIILFVPFTGFGAAPPETGESNTLEPLFSAQEQEAIRGLITDHLSALQTKDATAAFAQLSPPTQLLFKTAGNFMRLMIEEFPILVATKKIIFVELIELDGYVVEVVQLIGPDGMPVNGLVIVDQMDDDTWRINSIGIMMARHKPI